MSDKIIEKAISEAEKTGIRFKIWFYLTLGVLIFFDIILVFLLKDKFLSSKENWDFFNSFLMILLPVTLEASILVLVLICTNIHSTDKNNLNTIRTLSVSLFILLIFDIVILLSPPPLNIRDNLLFIFKYPNISIIQTQPSEVKTTPTKKPLFIDDFITNDLEKKWIIGCSDTNEIRDNSLYVEILKYEDGKINDCTISPQVNKIQEAKNIIIYITFVQLPSESVSALWFKCGDDPSFLIKYKYNHAELAGSSTDSSIPTENLEYYSEFPITRKIEIAINPNNTTDISINELQNEIGENNPPIISQDLNYSNNYSKNFPIACNLSEFDLLFQNWNPSKKSIVKIERIEIY
jgi:hypothetical protein